MLTASAASTLMLASCGGSSIAVGGDTGSGAGSAVEGGDGDGTTEANEAGLDSGGNVDSSNSNDAPPGGDDETIDSGMTDDGTVAGDGEAGSGNEAGSSDAGNDSATDGEGGACSALGPGDGGSGSVTVSTGNLSGQCTIALMGQITELAYEPTQDIAYGIDPSSRLLSAIALTTGTVTYRSVLAVPNALCVSRNRSRLFVVDSGSSFIDEFALADLSLVRRIPWPAPSYDVPAQSRFQVYCGANRLFVIDSSWAPGLWTIDNLDGCPVAVDHTGAVSGVGGMVLSMDESEFYYWYQYGRVAGQAGTSVYRVATGTWAAIDQATVGYQQGFYRDPLDTPILWDHIRNLIFAKNRVFDAKNLANVMYTFSNAADASLTGAYQNAYAIDPARGRMATRHDIFSVDTFMSVGSVTESSATQYFVSADGKLRTLLTGSSQLTCQTIP
jgi:hypothetical protein